MEPWNHGVTVRSIRTTTATSQTPIRPRSEPGPHKAATDFPPIYQVQRQVSAIFPLLAFNLGFRVKIEPGPSEYQDSGSTLPYPPRASQAL